ncbi:MAG: DUF4126 family protein [Thermoanaerobaculia bacterium]|nr:DUF4126 family protein [Thermoanaerobaculia bacterium]
MTREETMELVIAATFGALSGMRTFSGPTVAALLKTLNEDESGPLGDRLNGKRPLSILGGLALLELIGDKLPAAGDRIDPAPMIGRIAAGALAGALVCRDRSDERVASSAGVGALSALGAAVASFHLRRSIRENTGAPDILLGMLEDGAVYGSALVLLQQLLEE